MLQLFNKILLDERGSVLPLVGFLFIALVGSTGLAVDSGRAYLVQSRLSSSLDAAGLAAGASLNTTNLDAEVTEYLRANFPTDYMEAEITNITVMPNEDFSVIDLSATANMPTTFMGIFGQNEVEVTVTSQITRANNGLELVLVLDTTGSMNDSIGGTTKIAALRSAARDLLAVLYGTDTTQENLWIGIVPFSQAVNVGSTRSTWLDGTSFNWGPTSWGGCVEAREANNRDVTDDPPSVALFRAYYWPDHNTHNDWIRNDGTFRTPLSGSRGPNRDCPSAVTPMTANRTTLETAITNLQVRGNTQINTGAVWGWRMLSPRWRGLWGGEMDTNSLPLDYNTDNMLKATIIMTDGDNVITNSGRGAYGYLSDGRLGTTNQTTAETRLDQRLTQVCTSMKNNNILVYTIGFGNMNTATLNLLRGCATQADFFFASPTPETLQSAFRQIGDSLANLRVSR